ncbi:killer cell lectin-like receptor subfamily G member 1 isoform X2 [Pelodiscus sinensis]|uniref:killer cell lectin-like receptor subfamily G member 1 isoform X2 n=1 Tax=Pelodiscus sinensis TaxID=13735 RepID=UPI003F6BC5DF
MDGACEMAEGVVYAELNLPPPAPRAVLQRLSPLVWQRAALGLALLCLLLLAALVGLGLHGRVGRCASEPGSAEESGFLAGRYQCCPAGWQRHGGKCYFLSSAKRDWESSREDCCSRGARLATLSTNATLAFLQRVSRGHTYHVGLKRDRARADWKWADGSALNGLFPLTRLTASFLACGRVSGSGLVAGQCSDACPWICEQSALALQCGHGPAPRAFLWGNTTYTCTEPQ